MSLLDILETETICGDCYYISLFENDPDVKCEEHSKVKEFSFEEVLRKYSK